MKLLAGTRKGLFTLEGDGSSWEITDRQFIGDSVPMLLASPDQQQLLVVLGTGHFGTHLHRSIDNGKSFKEIGVPVYPEKPESSDDPCPWSLEMIWSLESGHDGKLWAGTIPGGLFSSTDSGESWSLNETLWNRPGRREWFGGGYDWPGIHSICVNPVNQRELTVALSVGGIYRTTDDGATWNPCGEGLRADYVPPDLAFEVDRQDPHRIVQCPAQPDHWWMQHHNGIWKSTDNCSSWTEVTDVTPSTFGFAVACHPADGNTAWFVPAVADESRYPVDGKMVVTKTTDGGKTFQQLRKGLPQSDAYDLVYRHCLEVCDKGETLLMGSTTGNLWSSIDAGRSWQSISNHLPPILCLRLLC